MPQPEVIEPVILSAAIDEESAQRTITLVLATPEGVDPSGKLTVGYVLKMELPSKPQP